MKYKARGTFTWISTQQNLLSCLGNVKDILFPVKWNDIIKYIKPTNLNIFISAIIAGLLNLSLFFSFSKHALKQSAVWK